VVAVDEDVRAMYLEMLLDPNATTRIKPSATDNQAKREAYQRALAAQQARDWANLCRYQADNAAILATKQRPRVVFIGDSITENWQLADPDFFGANRVDRGISGQTTPQILLRFYQDVVALQPDVVHIMAGTNDIVGNTGPTTDGAILDNIRAMIDIAHANDIRVVLASVLPAKTFSWQQNEQPAQRIQQLNTKLRLLAKRRNVVWLDYHTALTDPDGGLPTTFANDGVHPNRTGYAIMRPLAEEAIAEAVR